MGANSYGTMRWSVSAVSAIDAAIMFFLLFVVSLIQEEDDMLGEINVTIAEKIKFNLMGCIEVELSMPIGVMALVESSNNHSRSLSSWRH